MNRKHPTIEHISTERTIYTGYRITYLVNGTIETLHYHGYTKAEAEHLAKQDARKLSEQIYILD